MSAGKKEITTLRAERNKSLKLIAAIEAVIGQTQCCKEDYVIKSIRKVLQKSIKEYKRSK